MTDTSVSKDRRPAKRTDLCIRRIPPWSKHWKEADQLPTSLNFKDSELSIDLFQSPFNSNEAIADNRSFINDGFGLAVGCASDINEILIAKQIFIDQTSTPGSVLEDPLEDNKKHGIITGKETRKKGKVLKDKFTMIKKPLVG